MSKNKKRQDPHGGKFMGQLNDEEKRKAIFSLINEQEYELAIKMHEQIRNKTSSDYYDVAIAYAGLGAKQAKQEETRELSKESILKSENAIEKYVDEVEKENGEIGNNIFFELGKIYLVSGDKNTADYAIKYFLDYKKLAGNNPPETKRKGSQPSVNEALAILYARKGDVEKSREYIEKEEKNSPIIHFYVAQQYYDDEQYELAKDCVEKYLEILLMGSTEENKKELEYAYCGLCDIYSKLGDFEKTKDAYENYKILAQKSGKNIDYRIYEFLGDAYISQANQVENAGQEAIKYYELFVSKAFEEKNEKIPSEIFVKISEALKNYSTNTEIIQYFEKCKSKFESYRYTKNIKVPIILFKILAEAYYREYDEEKNPNIGLLRKAETYYKRVLLNEESSNIVGNLSKIYSMLGKDKKAENENNKIINWYLSGQIEDEKYKQNANEKAAIDLDSITKIIESEIQKQERNLEQKEDTEQIDLEKLNRAKKIILWLIEKKQLSDEKIDEMYHEGIISEDDFIDMFKSGWITDDTILELFKKFKIQESNIDKLLEEGYIKDPQKVKKAKEEIKIEVMAQKIKEGLGLNILNININYSVPTFKDIPISGDGHYTPGNDNNRIAHPNARLMLIHEWGFGYLPHDKRLTINSQNINLGNEQKEDKDFGEESKDVEPSFAFDNYEFYILPNENGMVDSKSIVIAERYYEDNNFKTTNGLYNDGTKTVENNVGRKLCGPNATYLLTVSDLVTLLEKPKRELIAILKNNNMGGRRKNHVPRWGYKVEEALRDMENILYPGQSRIHSSEEIETIKKTIASRKVDVRRDTGEFIK